MEEQIYYKGRPIEELSREELIEALGKTSREFLKQIENPDPALGVIKTNKVDREHLPPHYRVEFGEDGKPKRICPLDSRGGKLDAEFLL